MATDWCGCEITDRYCSVPTIVWRCGTTIEWKHNKDRWIRNVNDWKWCNHYIVNVQNNSGMCSCVSSRFDLKRCPMPNAHCMKWFNMAFVISHNVDWTQYAYTENPIGTPVKWYDDNDSVSFDIPTTQYCIESVKRCSERLTWFWFAFKRQIVQCQFRLGFIRIQWKAIHVFLFVSCRLSSRPIFPNRINIACQWRWQWHLKQKITKSNRINFKLEF